MPHVASNWDKKNVHFITRAGPQIEEMNCNKLSSHRRNSATKTRMGCLDDLQLMICMKVDDGSSKKSSPLQRTIAGEFEEVNHHPMEIFSDN